MNKSNFIVRHAVLGLAIMPVMGSVAKAALYGNFNGPDISYVGVTEEDSQISGPPTVTSTPTGLFGAPVLSPPTSDNLTFPALTFSALGADGTFDFQDGKLTMNIVPSTTGTTMHSLSFDEGGGWQVLGPSSDASVNADLLFSNLTITAVNGNALSSAIIVNPTFTENIVTQAGTATTSTQPGAVTITSAGDEAEGTWDITASFNLDAALTAADVTGRITDISVALDDQLLAQTTDTTSLTLAEIDKKHFIVSGDSTTSTQPVPEPASVSLLIGGGLLMFRRRRSASR